MTPIKLTDEQRQTLQADQGKPIEVIDPATQQHYVLLAREQFERVRSLLEREKAEKVDDAKGVPPGIIRSQQAFWRDLPGLLQSKNNVGKWVCYHGDERIGISAKSDDLIRECLRRGLKDEEYGLDVIEPNARAPWESEDIATGGNEIGDVEVSGPPENGTPA